MKFLKRNFTPLLSFFVFLVILSAFILPSAAASTDAYDYSRPGSAHNATLSSADILELYLGTELAPAERGYLHSYGELSLSYNDAITTDKIVCGYEDGTLTVTAYE